MTLTKLQITKRVQDLGFPQRESAKIVETLLEIIKQSLEDGEDVLISGFGKFAVSNKAPRRGRNPATGDDLYLDARRVVTFRSSGKLRKRINDG